MYNGTHKPLNACIQESKKDSWVKWSVQINNTDIKECNQNQAADYVLGTNQIAVVEAKPIYNYYTPDEKNPWFLKLKFCETGKQSKSCDNNPSAIKFEPVQNSSEDYMVCSYGKNADVKITECQDNTPIGKDDTLNLWK